MKSAPPASTRADRRIALGILFLVGSVSYMDRYILLVLVEPIKAELHLTDTQMGLLNGLAFALFYTMLGVPLAMLADRTHRVRLVAIACFVWSAFTAAGGLASNFLMLAMARIGVGIGEAGSTAPAISILSDYYPPHRRPLVIGIFTASGAVGVFAASVLGGWLAKSYGWRDALFIVAALCWVVAPLLLLCVREPQQGAADPVPTTSHSVPGLGKIIALFLHMSSLRFLMVGMGLAPFVGVALLAWAPAFLMRVQGMDIAVMGVWFGVASGLSVGIGAFGGGAITNMFAAKFPQAYALIPCICMIVATPFMIAGLLAHSWQLSLLCLLVPMTLTQACAPPAMALVQNLAPRNARATACSLLILIINIVGVGGGPLFVGFISDASTKAYGIDGLRIALLWLAPICLVSATAFYISSRAAAGDVEKAAEAC